MLLPSNTPLDGEGCVCPWLNNELKDWVLKVQEGATETAAAAVATRKTTAAKRRRRSRKVSTHHHQSLLNHSSFTTPPPPIHPSTSYLMYRSSHLPSLDAFPHNPSTTTCCTSSGAM